MLTLDTKVNIYQNEHNDYFIRDMENEVSYVCWAEDDVIQRTKMSKDEWEKEYNIDKDAEFMGNIKVKDFFGNYIEIDDEETEE